MSERTVLSSFYSQSDAEAAAIQIHELGVETVQVDELHRYPTHSVSRPLYTISGDIPSLASLTLHSTPYSRDAAVLLATDPSASGMADGRDNITGRNFLLTVVCPENDVESVVSIIKSTNGYT